MDRRGALGVLSVGITAALSGCIEMWFGTTEEGDVEEYIEFDHWFESTLHSADLKLAAESIADEPVSVFVVPRLYAGEEELPISAESEPLEPGESAVLTMPIAVNRERFDEITGYELRIRLFRELQRGGRETIADYEEEFDDFHERLE